ncbi:hypothetical protein HAALTHF_29810n [Vreelandella aquamarina]|nr:hypothetical protein HAALTHF_29810n [Halomonas axialensis]
MIDQTLLEAVERIAREAGDAIMKVYARDFSVEEKEDKSPLTEGGSSGASRYRAWPSVAVGSPPDSPKRTWKGLRAWMPTDAIISRSLGWHQGIHQA